jgi:hypothetical protein
MNTNKNRWTKIDELWRLPHIDKDDRCFALFDYNGHDPWKDSEGVPTGHSHIKNYKRLPSELSDNLHFQQFKREEISFFSERIYEFLSDATKADRPLLKSANTVALLPIPPSHVKSDPDYDDRNSRTCETVSQRSGVSAIEPVYLSTPISSSHDTGTRDPCALKQVYAIDRSVDLSRYDLLFIVDDVLTTGCHFATIKKMIHEICPEVTVVGLFFARAFEK